jgi:hypothetical protein
VESVEFPRWVVAASILLIGLVLLLGALADNSGKLRMPGAGSVLCMAAVGVAAVLSYSRRSRHSLGKDRTEPLASKGSCTCPDVPFESPTLRREEGKSITQRAHQRRIY